MVLRDKSKNGAERGACVLRSRERSRRGEGLVFCFEERASDCFAFSLEPERERLRSRRGDVCFGDCFFDAGCLAFPLEPERERLPRGVVGGLELFSRRAGFGDCFFEAVAFRLRVGDCLAFPLEPERERLRSRRAGAGLVRFFCVTDFGFGGLLLSFDPERLRLPLPLEPERERLLDVFLGLGGVFPLVCFAERERDLLFAAAREGFFVLGLLLRPLLLTAGAFLRLGIFAFVAFASINSACALSTCMFSIKS